LLDSSHDNYSARYMRPTRARLNTSNLVLVLTVLALVLMGMGYFRSLRPVTLQIDQKSTFMLSNQTTVGGILNEAGVKLYPEDIVFPALEAPVPDTQPISIRLARAIQIHADSETISRRTQKPTIGEALREAGVTLRAGDRVLIDEKPIEPSLSLPRKESVLAMTVQRAIPIQVDDNGAQSTVYATAPTLGEALRQAGLIVYLGDAVTPDLGTPITPGWSARIQRSRVATIKVDNRTIRTRTLGNTVADVLTQEGIELKDKDYTIPAATEALREGMTIQVTRVREEFLTESEFIPFETSWKPDASMDIDSRKTAQAGQVGLKKRTIRMTYENGLEIKRVIDREWVETGPTTQIINYGTKITRHNLTLPDGSIISYWRKIRMLATSYTAATSGKARTHPEFGITATGMRATVGVVAVDPRVVNLRSKLYIPGYGVSVAGDTGGRILGKRIDLGYDEWNLVLWYKWVDVYLLDPPPSQINWIIPDSPKERFIR
jgi:uncharacterized protein YabE (DUF348 family)